MDHPEETRRRGAAARRRAHETFGLDAYVARTRTLYEELWNERPGPARAALAAKATR
jgi:hypothetical protein